MATKKQNIIVVQGSYHGRTFGTMAMTKSKTVYGEGFGPLMVSVLRNLRKVDDWLANVRLQFPFL